VETADGNYVVVDLGQGRFALYAHLQPGSLRVKVGDRVRTGDVLGLLGNTGNTDGPHLHFHVMDGPSPLTSDGLPFVFTSFTGQGVVTDEAKLVSPFPPTAPVVPVDATRLAGPHAHQLPWTCRSSTSARGRRDEVPGRPRDRCQPGVPAAFRCPAGHRADRREPRHDAMKAAGAASSGRCTR
jgi:hypothetical protein